MTGDAEKTTWTFLEIAEQWLEDPNQAQVAKNIPKNLRMALWKNRFTKDGIGINEHAILSGLLPAKAYPPDDLPESIAQPKGRRVCLGNPTAMRDFEPFKDSDPRDEIFSWLLIVEEPIAKDLVSKSREEAFRRLADTPISEFSEEGEVVVGNVSLTRVELLRWCTAQGYKAPTFLKSSSRNDRRQAMRKTLEKYESWRSRARAIKVDDKSKGPMDIARQIAKENHGVKGASAANVKRRLDENFPGWAG